MLSKGSHQESFMITGRQIRAARGLLGWDATDLAAKAGLTRETVSKIENDSVQARESTLKDIVSAFDKYGVEFTDNSGVRIKPLGVEVLYGQSGLHQFFNNVYEYLRSNGGTIVQLGIDEKQFVAVAGNEFSESYKQRMITISEQRKDIKILAILKEGDENLEYSDFNEYRWMPNEFFAPVPFYIYGETLAIMDFQTIPAPTIILHKFPAITKAYRKQFDAFWKMSKEPQISSDLNSIPKNKS